MAGREAGRNGRLAWLDLRGDLPVQGEALGEQIHFALKPQAVRPVE